MFVVSEAEATVICDVFQQHGELSAVVEMRRLFPGITDNRQARECGRTIASWRPVRLLPQRQSAVGRWPRPTRRSSGTTEPG
jgi:hypothetical protein